MLDLFIRYERTPSLVILFNDPLVDCLSCNTRYRTDEINLEKVCTRCGIKNWSDSRQFNMMFSTNIGAMQDSSSIAYLRPETAQNIFVQFKNIISTNRVKIPFGVMQIGKAFRNEITPRQFLFRLREFNQMEMEFFCHPNEAPSLFDYWVNNRYNFFLSLGIKKEHLKIAPHPKEDLSHYSSATSDIEYLYPFGWKEIEGIAYRTDFDLKNHSLHSKKELKISNEKESYIPHIVETSIGIERLLLVILCDAYCNEKVNDTEERIVLKIHHKIAPYKIAFFPLTKSENELAKKLYLEFKSIYSSQFDDSGSIGKRYRRQDEIGTPFCITIDEQSITDQTVTIRERDTMLQERIAISDLKYYLLERLA